MKYVLFILLFSLNTFNAYSQIITELTIKGLKITKEEFILKFVNSKINNQYDSLIFEQDIQNIKNLNLFFSVKGNIYHDKNTVKLTIEILEATYIYPIINISGFKDQLKVQAGANNINWQGKGMTIGGYYQYYDRHSFNLYQKTPRHKNNKTGHEISLGKYSTIEPLYEDTISSDFNFDNYSISLDYYYWLALNSRLSLGGSLFYERYENIEKPLKNYEIGHVINLFKYQLKTSYQINKINQHYELRNGWKLNIYLETIQTPSIENASFVKFSQEFVWMKKLTKTGYLAFKEQVGIATNNNSPFSPFVLDSYINIRGIGNRVVRGTAEWILNFEYRQRLLLTKYFFLQSSVYTDMGNIRLPGKSVSELLKLENTEIYGGLGIRIHSRFFYKTLVRIDYGWDFKTGEKGGFTFGLSQFF